MRAINLILQGTLLAAATSGTHLAFSQDFPNKPIRVLTSAPGGGADLAARLIAQAITGPLGQPVITENRAGGLLAAEFVSKSNPDGYTLILTGGDLWHAPLLQKMPYDPVKDFAPVALAVISPNIIVVHPSVAATSVRELIALAKAQPGALNYASGASGSANHLAGELFKYMAGVNIVRVAYKGSGPALNAVVGGEVQVMFANTNSVSGHIKTGRLRALAVTTENPSALAPGLPTAAAAGLPGFEAASKLGYFAPVGTPAARINKLNHEIVRALSLADIREKLVSSGGEPAGSSPAQLASMIKSEMATMSKLIKEAGIKVE